MKDYVGTTGILQIEFPRAYYMGLIYEDSDIKFNIKSGTGTSRMEITIKKNINMIYALEVTRYTEHSKFYTIDRFYLPSSWLLGAVEDKKKELNKAIAKHFKGYHKMLDEKRKIKVMEELVS